LNNRFLRNGIVTLVLVVGTAALLYMLVFQPEKENLVPYSGANSFLSMVASGQVKQVTQRANELDVTLNKTDPQGKNLVVTTKVPSEYVTNLDADVAAACA